MQATRNAEELAKPFLEIPCRCWSYSQRLQLDCQVKLEELTNSWEQLNHQRNEVKKKVTAAEGRFLKRTDAVDWWLKRVDSAETDVDRLQKEGPDQLDSCGCLAFFFPCTWWTRALFIEKLKSKIEQVRELQSQGNFQIVAEYPDRPAIPSFQVLDHEPTQGLESIFADVWKVVQDKDVKILGLYGMEGVGKTVLLKQICNECIRSIKSPSNTSGYDLVIWLKVSNEVDPVSIQNEIGKYLRLSWPENSGIEQRAEFLNNIFEGKRFVLLLDDIRKKIELSTIGIPRVETSNSSSKIVFTTQSELVCFAMKAEKKIIECWGWDNSWKLFKQIVGEETLGAHRDIPQLAQKVALECGGLPLLLTSVAQTMQGKRSPQEWNNAITELKKSVFEFTKMGVEVFRPSKLIYDDLPNDSIKSCFLFLSLFLEDNPIPKEEVIQRWIGGGFINDFADWRAAVDAGYDKIETLAKTSLLVSFRDSVKLHGFMREFALWIYRDCGQNVLVNTGSAVSEAPEAEKWKDAEIISLTRTVITQLSDPPECSKLLTLLLSDNRQLKDIHDKFFEHMLALKVLDLSRTGITKLPASIDKLTSLESLDLSGTNIDEFHCDIKKLRSLKYLCLEERDTAPKLPKDVIKALPYLQMLKLSDSYFGDSSEDKLAGIQDLACLKKLRALDIQISIPEAVKQFFDNRKLLRCTRSLTIKLDPSHSMAISLILPSSSGTTPQPSQASQELYFRCLETLRLQNVHNFSVSVSISNPPSFSNLRRVYLSNCHSIVNLNWLILAPNLRTLEIDSCPNLEKILSANAGRWEEKPFLDLEILSLRGLPCLESICGNELLFPCLKKIVVDNCPNLERLPLGPNNAKELQRIEGSAEWWKNLLWDNEHRSSFGAIFVPLD